MISGRKCRFFCVPGLKLSSGTACKNFRREVRCHQRRADQGHPTGAAVVAGIAEFEIVSPLQAQASFLVADQTQLGQCDRFIEQQQVFRPAKGLCGGQRSGARLKTVESEPGEQQ